MSIKTLADDVRHTFRMLRNSPGFSAVAILALALGIGANGTIFSTLKAMVLRPLAFPQLDRIVSISESLPKQGLTDFSVAPPNYRDLETQNTVFERVAAVRGRGRDFNLTGAGAPVRLEGEQVTASFFPLLGISPALGRTFTEREANADARVVVLSYSAWQRQFAGDANIIGRTILLDGGQTEIIGVMPPEFDFPIGADLWGPLPMTTPDMSNRGEHTLYVIGRLKPGISEQHALLELQTIAANLARQYPATNQDRSFSVFSFRKQLSGETRYFVSVLMWAAVFVLLLACANVANLQLARAVSRQKELAIRAALGASRWRIARQVLLESLMLSLAGGAAGLLIALEGISVTKAAVPPFIVQHIAGIKNIRLDSGVLLFTGIVAILTGLISGFLPALQSVSASGLYDALKSGMRGSSASPVRARLRSLLVISEIALALVLLVGAGLMVKGFNHLLTKYPGFDEYGELSARVVLPQNKYADQHKRAQFYAQVLDRLAAIPGVEVASAVQFVPNGWAWQRSSFAVENSPRQGDKLDLVGQQSISVDYFRQLRIPLRQGRGFSSEDGFDAQPVVIVSESFASRWWPAGDALGHRLRFGASQPWRTIVGVTGDIHQSTMNEHVSPTAYVPIAQMPPETATFLLRTRRDPLSFAPAARDAVAAVDPYQALYDFRTLRQLSTDNSSGIEFSAHMMMAFGVIAFLLAAAGIYAVMAYTVTQRIHEIAICMAVGAQPGDIRRMILGNSLRLAATGLAIGLPVAFALTRVMAGFLVGIIRLDSFTFLAITGILALAALIAGYVPARRAMRVDPMMALNAE
jgi:putative ABC transport system permease protein